MDFKKTLLIYLLLVLLGNISYAADVGEKTFNKVCASCHTGGIKGWLSGAPEIGDKSKWREFFARDSLEKMHQIVINGENDHKIKGGCKKCADSDINAAINYLTSNSK